MQEKSKEQLEQLYAQPCFAVLPIFDTRKLVWGYELSYRTNGGNDSDPSSDKDLATLSFIGTFLMNPTLDGSRNKVALLLPFSEASILEGVPQELSYEPTAVIVDEETARREGLLEVLANLKDRKYLVAIDNIACEAGSEAILQCADIIFVDISRKTLPEIGRTVQKVLPLGVILGAKGVESPAQFQAVKDLGFTLFHGGFFQRPEVAPGRKLSASTVSRFRLCHVMTDEYPNIDELTKIIQSDVALSYRFLTFVNSAAFGFHQKTDSIKRAFVHIGWERIKKWLWVMLIADIQPRGKTSELPYLCAIRGKFLEAVAAEQNRPDIKADSLFLLGLFSLLEAMLDLPAEQIMESLPIEGKIKATLCHEENEYSDWLEMARCFESADWTRLDDLLEKLRLDPMQAASAYCKAIVWTKSFYSPQPVDAPQRREVRSQATALVHGQVEAPAPDSEAMRGVSSVLSRIASFLRSIFLFRK